MKLERGKSYKYQNAHYDYGRAFFISLKNYEIEEFTHYLVFNISKLKVGKILLFRSEIFCLFLE